MALPHCAPEAVHVRRLRQRGEEEQVADNRLALQEVLEPLLELVRWAGREHQMSGSSTWTYGTLWDRCLVEMEWRRPPTLT